MLFSELGRGAFPTQQQNLNPFTKKPVKRMVFLIRDWECPKEHLFWYIANCLNVSNNGIEQLGKLKGRKHAFVNVPFKFNAT